MRLQFALTFATLLAAGAAVPLPAQKPAASPESTVLEYRGRITRVQGGSLLLMLDDTRPLLLRTSGKTRFDQDGKAIKADALRPGGWLRVRARLDEFSQLQALTVTVLPPADVPALERLLADAEAALAAGDEQSDANGRYTLRRAPAQSTPPPEGLDPEFLIERARIAAEAFAGTLPDFIAQESMSRYRADGRRVSWRLEDVITVEVVYENGQERYRNVRINSAPTNRKLEDLTGSWSTGEFASTQSGLLDARTNAQFTWLGMATERRDTESFRAAMYNFAVSEANSRWHISSTNEAGEKVEAQPAYRGTVWFDMGTARVLRIEMAASSLPLDYPLNAVESAVDYSLVTIGDQPTLLPARAESLACQRGTNNCSRNVIDFRQYQKFSADSTIDFGAIEDEPK